MPGVTAGSLFHAGSQAEGNAFPWKSAALILPNWMNQRRKNSPPKKRSPKLSIDWFLEQVLASHKLPNKSYVRGNPKMRHNNSQNIFKDERPFAWLFRK